MSRGKYVAFKHSLIEWHSIQSHWGSGYYTTKYSFLFDGLRDF